jgi:hypothetical protein
VKAFARRATMRGHFMNAFIAVALAAILFTSRAVAQAPLQFHWQVYGQLAAERIDGVDDTFVFDAERLRTRLQLDADKLTAVAQFDFAVNDPGERRPGVLTNAILDLNVAYRFTEKHRVEFGQFKTPLGMDFLVAPNALDITKRGMEFGLTLNRAFGVMLSGATPMKGLSYDVGVFNPAGLSAATRYLDSQVGHDASSAARVRYDREHWHAELAHGTAAHAGGPDTSDYAVNDVAVRYTTNTWAVKSEWIDGHDIRGDASRDESVYYIHGSYRVTPKLEIVARHYDGTSRLGASSTELSNTYLGFTRHFGMSEQVDTRLQVNYVLAGHDRLNYTGVRGFRDDSVFVQLQVHARN